MHQEKAFKCAVDSSSSCRRMDRFMAELNNHMCHLNRQTQYNWQKVLYLQALQRLVPQVVIAC
jgi:thiosulfate reductase cytochrome b subunit